MLMVVKSCVDISCNIKLKMTMINSRKLQLHDT